MREILFRGKSLSNNNWVYGVPVPIEINCAKTGHIEMVKCHSYDELDYYHLLSEDEEVDPSIISQSTGFKDSNGKKIFEGDIIEFDGPNLHRDLIWWSKEMNMMDAIPLDCIEFNGYDYWNSKYPNFTYFDFCLMMQDPWGDFKEIKVIGNIYDNLELLEEQNEN